MNVAQSKPGLIKEGRKNCREYATVIIELAGRRTEPVFLNVYGAPESIPRNEFRQPM
jgi:hypothetical protein